MKWILLLCAFVGCSSTAPGIIPDASDAADAASDAPQSFVDVVEASAAVTCAPTSKTGVDEGSVQTPAGTSVRVRTPTNYDPTVGAPLIIVYAACCIDGATMEEFTLLTPPATADGYVIAYADHISPAGKPEFTDAANVLPAVSAQYCIDPAHVFLTGHSDGGSLDEVVAIEGLIATPAIAPSASGVSVSTVAEVSCPNTQVAVFEQHSSGDTLFPISQGYGSAMATWWATCGGCGAEGTARSDGCIPYDSCSGDIQILYCQGTAVHGIWPNRDHAILAFFDQYR